MAEMDFQEVCLNGHQSTDSIYRRSELRRKFCPKCGEPTITACQSCKANIPGHIYYPNVYSRHSERVPSFCGTCGKPYPWTHKKIENFRELTDELSELSPEDRDRLNASLDELMRESPKTEIASLRFKKIAAKLGHDGYELLKSVAGDLLSETIKKTLFGG